MLTGGCATADKAVYASPANSLGGIEGIDHTGREETILGAGLALERGSITYALVDVFKMIGSGFG